MHRAQAVKISQEELERRVVEAGLSPENSPGYSVTFFFLTAAPARRIDPSFISRGCSGHRGSTPLPCSGPYLTGLQMHALPLL
jgi:hypothetical protein